MRAGLLRFPIVIQQETKVKGLAGETKKTWTEFTQTKANIVNMNGKKGVVDEQISNSRITEFTIRYTIGVIETMRIIYDGKIYKINYINKYISNNNQIIGAEFLERV